MGQLLAASGSSWRHLVHLAAFSSIWQNLGVSKSVQRLLMSVLEPPAIGKSCFFVRWGHPRLLPACIVESIFDACHSNLLEKFQFSRAIINGDDGLASVPEYEFYQQLFLLVAQSMWSPACAAFLASPIWVCSRVPNDLVNAADRRPRAILFL